MSKPEIKSMEVCDRGGLVVVMVVVVVVIIIVIIIVAIEFEKDNIRCKV